MDLLKIFNVFTDIPGIFRLRVVSFSSDSVSRMNGLSSAEHSKQWANKHLAKRCRFQTSFIFGSSWKRDAQQGPVTTWQTDVNMGRKRQRHDASWSHLVACCCHRGSCWLSAVWLESPDWQASLQAFPQPPSLTCHASPLERSLHLVC